MFPSGPLKSGSLGSGVLVAVDVAVAVEVDVCEGVAVAVDVEVAVGVDVDVGVEVEVDADVDADVAVAVEVGVSEGVAVAVEADVAVGVEVDLGLGFDVEVGGGGKYTNVFVGLAKTRAVLVENAVVVGGVVWVVTNVLDVDAVGDTLASVESCVMVGNEAPGVRATFIHTGFVRMAGSTGSMNPLGLWVRKSLFGSSPDSTLASSSQSGAKRRAHFPASRIQKRPKQRIRVMTTQSRFSFSVAGIRKSIERQAHINRGSGTHLFAMTGALDPDATAVRIYNAPRDGKSQSGPTTFEFGFA